MNQKLDLDAPLRARTDAPVRPRRAATLILVRQDRGAPQILMGRRSGGHDFMPDKWVFPGGRVDRCDFGAPAASELRAEVVAAVLAAGPGRYGHGAARALGVAAIRETFEEVGLLLARPYAGPRTQGAWKGFHRAAGGAPDLEALTFVARAVTPSDRPKRFDASFFMADAARLQGLEPDAGSGELDEIGWFGLREVDTLDLPAVTRMVCREVEQRLADGDRARPPLVLARPAAPRARAVRRGATRGREGARTERA